MSDKGWTEWRNDSPIFGPTYAFMEDAHCSYGVWFKVFSHFSEFRIYEWCDEDEKPEIDDSNLALTGTVKWDGCSDWDLNGNFHACSKEGIASLSKVMQLCWEVNQRYCPSAER